MLTRCCVFRHKLPEALSLGVYSIPQENSRKQFARYLEAKTYDVYEGKGRIMADKKRRNVTFELSEVEYEHLLEETKRAGMTSHHQRARLFLLDILNARRNLEIEEKLEEQKEQLNELAEFMRRLAYTAMVNGGKASSDEANDWIRRNIPKEPH